MKPFIEWLEKISKNNTQVRAILRRSLAFDPGTFVSAYPYVEPFIKDVENSWKRSVFYLVAGLWASHWREGRFGTTMSIGNACALYHSKSESANIEKRFINLLDADSDQLPHRLRQMIAILKDYSIDFSHLLDGLLRWNDDRKRTQNAWARDFYRNSQIETETTIQEESK